MQSITVRPATIHDVPAMAVLWHERMTLRQLTDRRLRVLPDGQDKWKSAAERWLADAKCHILVAQRDGEAGLIGYIIGHIEPNSPGISPESVGVVRDMAVGVHSAASGLGHLLLQPLRDWFQSQNVQYLVVYVPHRQPVEQAFWRSVRASEWIDLVWITL